MLQTYIRTPLALYGKSGEGVAKCRKFRKAQDSFVLFSLRGSVLYIYTLVDFNISHFSRQLKIK